MIIENLVYIFYMLFGVLFKELKIVLVKGVV